MTTLRTTSTVAILGLLSFTLATSIAEGPPWDGGGSSQFNPAHYSIDGTSWENSPSGMGDYYLFTGSVGGQSLGLSATWSWYFNRLSYSEGFVLISEGASIGAQIYKQAGGYNSEDNNSVDLSLGAADFDNWVFGEAYW